ncbi:AIPR family protein [Pinirhizobacter soli]|uniref:AIPR family protein n=1 Tax=Pinirhizobacter soli TaxID=2786953 RepID=UPI00202A9CE7|nr:AIPR family protein [Pinirhizobacter soli]
MAKNDLILLDSILKNIGGLGNASTDEQGRQFERFVLDQVLKGFDLSADEIDAGWVDGRHDGGIDGFYVFVNGHLVVDIGDFAWPKSGANLEVYVLTCRHRDTFKQEPLDALLASLQELLDLGRGERELAGSYSRSVLNARGRLDAAFRMLSLSRPRITFKVVYASRGDVGMLGESIAARGRQIEKLIAANFSAARAEFVLLGATELVEMYRQGKTFSLTLSFTEHLAASQDGYVVLADLNAYKEFVTDEQGHLRRYLFDSNVRDFLGRNRVNSDILNTLENLQAPNFWWLNNGVTILASSANVVGKKLQMQDIQIVNGLQTTQSIFLHFLEMDREPVPDIERRRFVLIKVIVTADEHVRDQVIRATNNQSAVDASALHATDKIQHDIEQVLNENGWFYERRTNYFKNAGKPVASIITPAFLASAVACMVFKNPTKSAIRRRFVSSPQVYAATFTEQHPIGLWPVLVVCMRLAEAALTREAELSQTIAPGHIANWRGLVAFLVVARHFQTFYYSVHDLARMNATSLTEAAFDEMNAFVQARKGGKARANYETVLTVIQAAAEVFAIEGDWPNARRLFAESPRHPAKIVAISIKPELLDAIDAALPSQPWPRHIHAQIARELSLTAAFTRKAIQELIRLGRREKQWGGKLLPRIPVPPP